MRVDFPAASITAADEFRSVMVEPLLRPHDAQRDSASYLLLGATKLHTVAQWGKEITIALLVRREQPRTGAALRLIIGPERTIVNPNRTHRTAPAHHVTVTGCGR